MKKSFLFILALALASVSFSQDKPTVKKVTERPGDHLMFQLSSDHWSGAPDSISDRMKGLSRGANAYIMLNKPFKGSPKMSIAFGIGVGTSNIFFEKTNVDVNYTGTKLPFSNLDSADRFKKYKLSTAYLEAPIELRFTADPDNDARSWKGAIGIKIGTLLNVHTKGKNLENKSGTLINSYSAKENSKKFFNTTRFAATARVGYGHFGLFGSYQVNNMFKDGVAPDIKPFQIGLTFSGL